MSGAAEEHALACRHLRDGRPDLAEQAVRRALASDTNYAPAWHLLGSLAYRSGRAPLAADCFLRAAQAEPANPTFHSCLGAALKELGRLDEAAACHRRALGLRPGDPLALNNLAITLMAQGRVAEAADAFRRARDADPDDPAAACNLAAALKELGRLEEAAALYEQVLGRWPGLAQAHNNLGNLRRDQGRLEEARACYERAAGLEPRLVQAHRNLGLVLRDRGRPAEAAQALGRAVELEGGPDEVLITEYDPDWPLLFAREAQRIRAALGADLVIAVEHMGSTAVPGLAAKPIIDLMVGVRSLDEARRVAPGALGGAGYAYCADDPCPDRLFFLRRQLPDGPRTHHVHVVEYGCAFWSDHLLFRDYLRANPEAASRYAAVKLEMAQRFRTDRVAYNDAKAGYIRAVKAEARRARTSPEG
jgi:GrpB-like predicted nucleotidyltransferase (UPF0157 family)/Tfp pilus assembly protein PilF